MVRRLQDMPVPVVRSGPSGIRPAARRNDDPYVTFGDEEEDTLPKNHNVALYQQIILVFDDLSPNDRQRFLVLATAYSVLHPDDREILVSVAERMAGFK